MRKWRSFSYGLTFPLKPVLDAITHKLKKDQSDYLENECANMSKLRTFLLFKHFGSTASHLTKPLTFLLRKAISKVRLGSLELRIESGRYHRPLLKIHERSCLSCYRNSNFSPVETEYHFLFGCPMYDDLRSEWFPKMTLPENFQNLADHRKLDLVLNKAENVKYCAQFILNALKVRQNHLYLRH